MRFQDALQSRSATLTDADRRIGNVLLSSSLSVSKLTAAQLAAKAAVHESTVVRFAQKLGYDGFPELRAGLAAEYERLAVGESRFDAERDPSLAAVVASQIELLSDLPRLVPQASVDAAASRILAAERVLVIGRGLMLPAATFMTRKLLRAGATTMHSYQGAADAVEHAALLRPGDAVLTFAFHDEYTTYGPLVGSLTERGVNGVLVSDQEALFAGNLPEIVLPLPRRNTDHGVVGAIIAIAYAIEYSMVAQRPKDGPTTSERIAELARSAQMSHLASGLGRLQDLTTTPES